MSSLDNNVMNGSDNAAKEPQETQVLLIVESIILSILCVVGLFGNLLTIVAIVRTNKLRITGNYFLVNLALADIIVCVIIEPFYLLTLISDRWPFSSKTFCVILAAMAIIALVSSVLNLLAIAVNRYFCIVQNQRYATLYTTCRSIFYCVMIWVGSFILVLPAGSAIDVFGYNEYLVACGIKATNDSWIYQIITMLIMFAFSMMTFFFCYYKICKTVQMSSRRSRRRKNSTTSQVSVASSVRTLHKLQRNLSKYMKKQNREIKVAKTSFIILITFMICWTPAVLQVVFDRNHSAPSVLVHAFALLSLANSSVNPFIYAWRNRHFRNAYKRIITCRHFFGRSKEEASTSNSKNNDSSTV
ncbi:octopamine receptor beta-2R-like [Antedon mediterranea]|uniref:octopamine receptor beta-2R-like n=1 Tax=Antedon mediterranea TaxID=105859 RepID=UPI003AF5B4F5